MTWSAPSERTSSTLRALHTPVTSAPRVLAICTANVPTPPDAPLINTAWPGCTSPTSRRPRKAVPVAAVTALRGLRDVGEVQPGHAVLINGASGGVGTFAVQIAKTLGADVTGVCSARNVELVRSLGADHVIDYTREDFARSGQRYDVILDLAGQHPLSACRGALTRTGTLVLASGNGGPVIGPLGRYVRALALSPFVPQRLRVHASKPSQSDLAALTALIEAESVTPVIEATYALADTAEAMRHLAEQHARAKIVIAVRGSHAGPQPSTNEGDRT